MKCRLLAAAALVCAIAFAGGCTTAAKQALYAVTGASGRYFEIKEIEGPDALDRFNSVQVKAFGAQALGDAMPEEVITLTSAQIVEKLRQPENKAFFFDEVSEAKPSRGPVLIIEGDFIDYDPGGSPARAVGLGGNPFVTARIRLIDGSSGALLGIAHVTGTVKSAVRVGNNELASGLAKAVRGLIKAHHSKPLQEEIAEEP